MAFTSDVAESPNVIRLMPYTVKHCHNNNIILFCLNVTLFLKVKTSCMFWLAKVVIIRLKKNRKGSFTAAIYILLYIISLMMATR